jgi:hypothetical protein
MDFEIHLSKEYIINKKHSIIEIITDLDQNYFHRKSRRWSQNPDRLPKSENTHNFLKGPDKPRLSPQSSLTFRIHPS